MCANVYRTLRERNVKQVRYNFEYSHKIPYSLTLAIFRIWTLWYEDVTEQYKFFVLEINELNERNPVKFEGNTFLKFVNSVNKM